MTQEKRKTKTPVLTNRIAQFIEAVRQTADRHGRFDTGALSQLWDEEVRFHFDAGRTEKTLELYIMKYRAALKAAFGPKSTPLAICNMKKLKERLTSYIDTGTYKSHGIARSLEERLERSAITAIGRKPTLLLRIANFIAAMREVKSREEMERLWQDEVKALDGRARSTLISYITKYRNAIREAYGQDHPMLKIAAGTADLYDEARRNKMAVIAEKNGALIVFDQWREVIARCTQLIGSSDPLSIGIGLIGLTGRRPYEVFTQAEFSPAPYGRGLSKWSVLFKGQAKTKGGEGTKFNVTYEIPTLAPAHLVLDAYRRLRESGEGKLWHKMSLDDFSLAARLPLRDAMMRIFDDLWPGEEMPKPYGLRHLYAEVAYTHFAPHTVSKNSYYAAILGHQTNDLETSLSYMTYCLPGDRDEAAKRNQRMVERTQRQLEEIERDRASALVAPKPRARRPKEKAEA